MLPPSTPRTSGRPPRQVSGLQLGQKRSATWNKRAGARRLKGRQSATRPRDQDPGYPARPPT
eukprot:8042377-Pyramimonas_sp.AAC.1